MEKFETTLRQQLPYGRTLKDRFFYVCRAFVRNCLKAPLDFRFLEQFHNSPYGGLYRRDQIFANKKRGDLRQMLEEGQREKGFKVFPNSVLSAPIFGPLPCLGRDETLDFALMDQPLTHPLSA